VTVKDSLLGFAEISVKNLVPKYLKMEDKFCQGLLKVVVKFS
jgi:hypothetical protein